jgi:hypothetical protein
VLTFIASGRCGSCSPRWPWPSARDREAGHNANVRVKISFGIVIILSFIISLTVMERLDNLLLRQRSNLPAGEMR